jgi:1-acyl-sn-glycerol-3-phosphate acyltransferase
LGSLFVERVDTARSLADQRAIEESVSSGVAPLVFAEGTLRREPGLLAFRMGAFVAAAQAGVPVIPVVMRGTRAMLPDRIWVPRPARLEVWVGEPIAPEGSDWRAAIALRDKTREAILAHTGEPDASEVRIDFRDLSAG